MQATGRRLPIDERDWLDWIQPSRKEPERPAYEARWIGLPEELGDIASIAPAWRLGPAWRHVYCPHCHIEQGGVKRWPSLVAWLDARRLQCSVHACPLVYRDPAIGTDPGHAACQLDEEMIGLYRWTRQWIRLDGWHRSEGREEAQWRRDLVRMVCRNWSPGRCHSAASLGAWELHRMGWYAQERSVQLDAGHPGRLGVLSPPERIGGLLLAYRCWQLFRPRPFDVIQPQLPQVAWRWLARRWTGRFEGWKQKNFVARVCNFIEDSRS